MAGADGRTARFRDGTTLETGIIIWATGFRPDYSWIGIPGVIRDGKVVHQRGVTGVPGLYFLGLSWQHTRGSALLGFVDDDAAYLAGHITTDAQATQPAPPDGATADGLSQLVDSGQHPDCCERPATKDAGRGHRTRTTPASQRRPQPLR